jgi:hypothetical protein
VSNPCSCILLTLLFSLSSLSFSRFSLSRFDELTPPAVSMTESHTHSLRIPWVWESKAKNLLITVESLRDNPVYERARLRHEQELQHAEKVITTIKGEGFWDGRIHNG